MRTLIATSALFLCACASHTPVMPLGNERFMVGYQAHGGLDSWTEVKAEAIKLANAHCTALGKTPEILGTEETGARGWTPMNVEVTFSCR